MNNVFIPVFYFYDFKNDVGSSQTNLNVFLTIARIY